ncbi:MAG TPA: LLM class flavin-dependent oxidoreductase [Acidimicrobiia bacterium]|jgi:coenzyme F420-dependent glucose-6-phosphate dehydrogenase|nr:LLM class flavin-dependent oxidoreductase [Acidimicrobiia bacterium]
MTAVVRVGLTLPSFQSEPDRVLAVARVAEDAGLDGVFLFDHLFRRRGDAAGAERRPALELLTMTAAVAATTERVAVGTLVARATLRPPATLRAAFDTLACIAPGRIIAGLGGGDDESLAEDTAFGVLPGDPAPASSGTATLEPGAYRLDRLEATVEALVGRAYPVWVAGVSPGAVRIAAERADGWNRWGGLPASFGAAAERVRAEVANSKRHPDAFTSTWGGLAVLGTTRAEAEAKRDRLGGDRPDVVWGDPPRVAEAIAAYAAAGADWVILGPIDSANPSNAALLGKAVELMRAN